jgi:hypothetical protein
MMPPRKIVALNMYYAREGGADEVLQTRCDASRVRLAIGLPAGRILRRVDGDSNSPHVVWECQFDSIAAHDLDMGGRGDSQAFEAVRERMRKLLVRFERTLWTIEDGDAELYGAASLGSIHVLNEYYAAQGCVEQVLEHRIHASDVRESLGHKRGWVLRRVSPLGDEGSELPDVLWQLNYADLVARESDFSALTGKQQFQVVMEKMRTLTRHFGRSVWKSAPVSPHISPIREDMAQDTVHCPRAAHTHCICKRGQCAVDSRDKPDRVKSVRYAG